MSAVELTEAFLAKIAGWEAMKRARALLESGKVLSSNWTPPILRGVVQEGTISYRAGLVIKDSIDLENMCGCRESRQWGTICAHSVAVGLHHLHRNDPVPEKGSVWYVNFCRGCGNSGGVVYSALDPAHNGFHNAACKLIFD